MARMAGEQAVYGAPDPRLADVDGAARQLSPLVPGAFAIEAEADGSLARIVVAAPPGVLERRYVLAQALRALKPGGELIALALKDKGGARLRGELEAFGCTVIETSKAHHRICQLLRPEQPASLAAAIADGGPQQTPRLSLWSQPGVFSWDRLDPGTSVLAPLVRGLSGKGADFGCGVGLLAMAVLAAPKVTHMTLIDIDRRAVDATRRNITDPRAEIVQADVCEMQDLTDLDFVVTNPPFHNAGADDRRLGQAFIRSAARSLRKGGSCWLVANVGLPYEAVLTDVFKTVTPLGVAHGYKLFEARK